MLRLGCVPWGARARLPVCPAPQVRSRHPPAEVFPMIGCFEVIQSQRTLTCPWHSLHTRHAHHRGATPSASRRPIDRSTNSGTAAASLERSVQLPPHSVVLCDVRVCRSLGYAYSRARTTHPHRRTPSTRTNAQADRLTPWAAADPRQRRPRRPRGRSWASRGRRSAAPARRPRRLVKRAVVSVCLCRWTRKGGAWCGDRDRGSGSWVG